MAGVVVVGGGAGGDAAALTLRRHGYDRPITIVSADTVPPYERPLLSKQVLTGERSPESAALRSADAYAAADVELLLGQRAEDGDAAAQTLLLDSGAELRWEQLVLVPGSAPRALAEIPSAANVLTLRSLEDSLRLRSLLTPEARLLIVGAGFLGCEVAASARALGCAVVLCDVAAAPMLQAVGSEVGTMFADLHRSHGVDVRLSTTWSGCEVKGGRVTAVTLDDGSTVGVDVVLQAVGAVPQLELARRLGLRTAGGGVAVDECLHASATVLCAGDIAAQEHPLCGARVRSEHWQVAQRHGEWIGAHLTGAVEAGFDGVAWFWSDQYDSQLTQAGWPQLAERTVVHGDPGAMQLCVFGLRGDRLVSALGVNQPRLVRRARRLIATGVGAAEALEDLGVDVRSSAAAAC